MKFLYSPLGGRPLLAVLYEDTRRARHIKAYEVGLREKVGIDIFNFVLKTFAKQAQIRCASTADGDMFSFFEGHECGQIGKKP